VDAITNPHGIQLVWTRGDQSRTRKIDSAKALEIRRRWQAGERAPKGTVVDGLSASQWNKIGRGDAWKHVADSEPTIESKGV